VDFTGSTKVTEVTDAALTDVTSGSCVTVQPIKESEGNGPITAQSVHVSPAVNGKCPQAEEKAPGSTPPSGSASTSSPAKRPPVEGAVAGVSGNTITLTSTDASGATSQTPVAVTDKTKYTKQAAASSQAITQGKCITARGTKDSNSTLQATAITVRPANNGKCPGEAKPPRHGG
jgi:hypothetical protein